MINSTKKVYITQVYKLKFVEWGISVGEVFKISQDASFKSGRINSLKKLILKLNKIEL